MPTHSVTRLRDNPVIVVALRAHRALTHSLTHTPKFACLRRLILPAADAHANDTNDDEEEMPQLTPISHLRALEAYPDGIKECVRRWTKGNRSRTVSLIISLCVEEQIVEEVATKLVEGLITPSPCRRPRSKKRRKVEGFSDFSENFTTSPDRPPPYVFPRTHETQASYWAKDSCTKQSYHYKMPADAYHAVIKLLA